MTGLPEEIGQTHEPFLNDGDLFDRDLDAEIPAGDHDPVRRLEDLIDPIQGPGSLDLGNDERMVIEVLGRFANGVDVRPGLDKGLTDRIDAVFRGELQALVVALGKGADAEIDARQVEPFAGPEFSADQDTASHVPPFDLHHLELDIIRHSEKAYPPVSRPWGEGQR